MHNSTHEFGNEYPVICHQKVARNNLIPGLFISLSHSSTLSSKDPVIALLDICQNNTHHFMIINSPSLEMQVSCRSCRSHAKWAESSYTWTRETACISKIVRVFQ